MSLIGALNTGQSALATAQAGLQVSGNNISNAGNADYTRQTAETSPAADQQIQPGIFIGTGVDLTSVQRQIDDALNGRLRNSISDNQAASTTQQWLTQVQSVFNALGTSNLSTSMSAFFDSWSNLANKPQDIGLRQVVLQQGDALAKQFGSQRQQLTDLNSSAATELGAQVQAADTLASQVASLNGQIVTAEGGTSGTANALRDQRDAALKQLSQLMNVSTAQQPNGSVNVYVGSEPLVFNTDSRGVALQNQNVNGVVTPTVVFKSTSGAISLSGGGQLGALSDAQARITGVVSQEDTLAHNLIFELNKVYSSGQGLQPASSLTATNTATSTTQPLNSTAAGLPFSPSNGSFVVHVTNQASGQVTSTLVQVHLTGAPGDSTLDSITTSLNAVSGITATDAGGVLKISAASSGSGISFSQDSSGALAALGVNTFYTGMDASDIAVNRTVASQPQMLAAAKNGDPGDNQTALAIAALAAQPVTSLNGTSLNDSYQSMVDGVATQVATAKTNAQAAQSVQDTLQSQRDSLSGVSLDEEAINLVKQQQAFQGAARMISIVQQMMQTVINMVQ
jgi:flagellar hook-associated protein 1